MSKISNMKYIRTKEYGVCKVTNEDKHTLLYENSYVCGCLWKDDYKDQIQQAATIEELCDEIVIRRNEKPYYSNSPIGKSKSWKAFQPLVKETKAIYGAIWTDKGLIYVAKMNEKGELELL